MGWLRLLLVPVAVYLGLCLLAFVVQRSMLYFPRRERLEASLSTARALGLVPWQDETGRLLGWASRHPSGHADGRLLVFHGNAGTALDRVYLRDVFQAPSRGLALDIVLAEYPGYGPRGGSPTEDSLVAAAVDAVDRLRRESSVPIVLVGESLGSAVAALAAARRPGAVQGLLLITPMKSLPAVARRHYPFLPAFLARDTFHTDRALPRLRVPVSFLIAGHDEVVFADLGVALVREYQGPKRSWVDEQAAHNSLDYDPRLGRWEEMAAFALQATPGP